MKDIDGSKPEIREAPKLITDAKWSMLIMQNEDVRGEANIKKHMIFILILRQQSLKLRLHIAHSSHYA